MMEDLNLSEEAQKLVELAGDPVGIDSGDCILWKVDHPNCAGCQYELGCGKVVRLMATMLIPMMYEPKGFDDFARMNSRVQELMDTVLKVESIEELHKLPMM